MRYLAQLTPQIYAFVKRNSKIRGAVMPLWRFMTKMYINVRSLIIHTEVLPLPTVICESTEQWIKTAKEQDPASAYSFQSIHPACQIKRELPKTIEKDIHWKFKVNKTHLEPATFVAKIERGRVFGNGNVITPDNQLLADVSRILGKGEYVKDASIHPIFSKEKLPPLQKVDGIVAVLSAAGGRGYYHWMFDVLPRIQLLWEAGINLNSVDKFLINNYVSKFHKETLDIIGIPKEKILENHWTPSIIAQQLIVPSLVGDTGHIPKYACDFLRKQFLTKTPLKADYPRRLYFNREQVTHRKVTNEPEIVDFVNKLGFKSIALESLPLLEQISLLANAEAVIVPHGAGLTNIVFCKPGTKVIELLSPHAVNVMYWTLSNQVELDYYYLLAEGPRPADFVNPYLNNHNLTINLKELADTLNLAGIR